MRTVLFSGLAVMSLLSHAQAIRNIDSLQHAVDTARLDSFKVRSCMPLFNAVVQSGDMPRAKCIADSQLVWSAQIGYKKGKRLAYTNYGTWYYHKGDLKKALEYYQASYGIAREMHSTMGMEMGLNNVGVIYKEMGLYDKALDVFNQALVIERANGFKGDEANTLGNISSLHVVLKNWGKAIGIVKQSQKLHLELQDTSGYTIALLREAHCTKALGDTATALGIFGEAIRLAKRVDYKQLQCDALNDYGITMQELHRYDSALIYHSNALRLAQDIGADNAIMVSLSWMGNAYGAQKKYAQAEAALNRAYALAKAQDDVDEQVTIAGSLAALYDSTHQYGKATRYLNEYIALHDSILSRDKQEAVERLQTQFETAEKEKQITALKSQQILQQSELQASRFKLTLLLGAIVFVAIAAALLVVYLRNRNKAKALEQTLRLRNVIAADLHDDIGSSLSSISLFSDVALGQLDGMAPRSAALLETISQTAHTTMLNMNDIVWSVNPANDGFENILSRMQQFAAGVLEAKNINLHFKADEELFLKKFPIHYRRDFYLLFKEAVNNLSKYSKAASAWITMQLENKTLRLTIRDDGIGFDAAKTVGNGLRTMRKRAQAMNGRLDIATNSQGTTVAFMVGLP